MRTVFVDVDTQLDFLCPAGALYVPGAEAIVDTVARLNAAAWKRGFPLISTTDSHAEDDSEFRAWPAHCIRGTFGQSKPASTIHPSRLVVPCSGTMHNYPAAPQFVIEKTVLDAFSNPNLTNLLRVLDAERYVVYGVVTEICVQIAVEGLLSLPGRIEVVEDAIRHLDESGRQAAIDDLRSKGVALVSASAVLA